MTIIEKIKAEIERLKKDNEISEDKDYAQYELDVACGYDMALDDVLSFLDTLEEPEKPTFLESEVEKWMQDNSDDNGFFNQVELARHFAQWGAEHSGSSEIPNELEAVECDVIVPIYEGNDVWSAEIKIPGRYEPGDKVRVIVIPNTDEK